MTQINSIAQIQGLISKVKERKKGYLTNFFLDMAKTSIWINLGLLEFEEIGETVFICRKNEGFNHLFIVTTSIAALANDLPCFISKRKEVIYVTDIVGKLADISAVYDVFVCNNFFQYTSLVRMSRIVNEPADEAFNKSCVFIADREKGVEVYKQLHEYFDACAEQLPLIEEINAWVEANRVIIYSDDAKTVQGFVIYELTGQTSYLRYWFVHPDHREKKIGSALLRKYFADSRGAKRQLFWVIETNSNAIKRYEYYGFRQEALFDKIMVNKDIRHI